MLTNIGSRGNGTWWQDSLVC